MSKIYVDEIAGIASPSTVAIPGHVIQVVEASTYTQASNTGTSFVDTGIEATITPSSTNSKILIVCSAIVGKTGSTYIACRFTRNGTSLGYLADLLTWTNNADWCIDHATFTQIDSPSSTDALNYKLQFSNTQGTGTVYSQIDAGSGPENGRGQITLMEIAG